MINQGLPPWPYCLMLLTWFLFLQAVLASQYGSISHTHRNLPEKEDLESSGNSPTKQIDNLSNCMLVVGGANMILTTTLQIFPRQICPDTSSVFWLIALAFPILMTLVWEMALAEILAQTIWSDHERPVATLKLISLFIFFLISVKIVGIFVPVEGYSGIFDEICSWRESTLFGSIRWVLTQTLPSILVPISAAAMVWLNENLHDLNKYEQ